jgi:hypothetical protein
VAGVGLAGRGHGEGGLGGVRPRRGRARRGEGVRAGAEPLVPGAGAQGAAGAGPVEGGLAEEGGSPGRGAGHGRGAARGEARQASGEATGGEARRGAARRGREGTWRARDRGRGRGRARGRARGGRVAARPRGLSGRGTGMGAWVRGGRGRGRRKAHGQEGRAGKKKGRGRREKIGKGRGKTHLRGSKLQRSRFQTLGHHGGRERGGRGRGRLLRGRNQMRQTDLGEGARTGWAGALGARGPDRAGLGHTPDRNPRHARPLNGIQSRTEIRNRTR